MRKYNCRGCIRRCVTYEQYLHLPPLNINNEVVDYNCLVLDEELDNTLEKPNCYKKEND